MRKPYDPIADEEPHIVAEYHFPNCTAYIADNYLRRLTPEQKEANRQAARRVAWQILERAAAEGRAHGQQLNAPQGAYIGVDIMANVKTYTLTLDAQELHDLIEAALVCECQAAQIIGGLKRKGLDLDAQKLVTQNARLSRLVRRMQETKEDKRNAETDSQRRRLV